MAHNTPTSAGIHQNPAELIAPQNSEMIRLQHRVGVVHAKAEPRTTASRSSQMPLTLESIQGALLREYIEQWLRNKCEPVIFSARASEVQIPSSSRSLAERTLISEGYLIEGPTTNTQQTIEPSSKAIRWMWGTPRMRSSLSRLANLSEPSADGSMLYRNARHAILAVIEHFQKSMKLDVPSLSQLLKWTDLGTQTWLKKASALSEIQLNPQQNGVILSPTGARALQDLEPNSPMTSDSETKGRKEIDHDELKRKIPHVIAGLVKRTGFSHGISCNEIGSALGVSAHFLRGSGILDSLVNAGTIARKRTQNNPYDSELGRFKAVTMLYSIPIPTFTPDTEGLPLPDIAAAMKRAAESNRPTGEQFADARTGYSVDNVKKVIAAFSGKRFTQAELRIKLAERDLLPKQADILQRTLKFLEKSGFLESHATKAREWGSRRISYSEKKLSN